MTNKSYQVGNGVTAETRKVTSSDAFSLDDWEDIKAAILRMPELFDKPWGPKAPLIKALRARLAMLQAEAPDPKDYIESAAYYKTRATEAWYVLTIIKYANHVEKCIEEGRHWEAISFAFDVGELVTELGFKLDWEVPALAGRKVLESQGRGAKAQRKRSPDERYQAVLAFIEKGHTVRRSFELAGRKFGDSKSTVSRDYYIVKKRSNPTRLER